MGGGRRRVVHLREERSRCEKERRRKERDYEEGRLDVDGRRR